MGEVSQSVPLAPKPSSPLPLIALQRLGKGAYCWTCRACNSFVWAGLCFLALGPPWSSSHTFQHRHRTAPYLAPHAPTPFIPEVWMLELLLAVDASAGSISGALLPIPTRMEPLPVPLPLPPPPATPLPPLPPGGAAAVPSEPFLPANAAPLLPEAVAKLLLPLRPAANRWLEEAERCRSKPSSSPAARPKSPILTCTWGRLAAMPRPNSPPACPKDGLCEKPGAVWEGAAPQCPVASAAPCASCSCSSGESEMTKMLDGFRSAGRLQEG